MTKHAEAVMSKYVWQHDLKGEADRLRLMSDLLDPSSEFHLLRTGITTGWRCLEIGAGNGSLSQWLGQRVGPAGHVIASDIRTDLMEGIAGGNLEVRKFDVVHDEPPDAPYDLVAIRALLHHLPERRTVVSKMARWLKPGGQLFVQEPDFYPTWTVEPPSQKHFWEQFIQWAATHQIDYYVGRKIPAWLQAESMLTSCGLIRISIRPFATSLITLTGFSPLITRPAVFGLAVTVLTASRATFAAIFAAVFGSICAKALCAKAHEITSEMLIEQSFM
jgi:ubiquinone/menaquinone biosynthesis C-methylase UbiE